MLDPLFDHVNRFVPLPPGDRASLEECLSVQTVRKKDHVLSAGDICHANYFILTGCFRMYFIKDSGHEHTIHFGVEHWWITDFTSMEKHQPSEFYIQAIETSEVAILTKDRQETLFRKVPQMERYFRLIAQRAFAASLRRIQFLFELSVETRYEQFSQLYPEFVQRSKVLSNKSIWQTKIKNGS